jgi:hypothetical protein
MEAGIDERFLARTYRTGVLIGLLIAIVLGLAYRVGAALSFAIGGALSLGLLWLLEYTVSRYLGSSGGSKNSKVLLALILAKYPVLMVGFYFLVKASWLSPGALAAGLGLSFGTIALKAFGIAFKPLWRRGLARR